MHQMRFVLGVKYFNNRDVDMAICDAIRKVKQTHFEVLYAYVVREDIVGSLNFLNTLSEDDYDWLVLLLLSDALLHTVLLFS